MNVDFLMQRRWLRPRQGEKETWGQGERVQKGWLIKKEGFKTPVILSKPTLYLLNLIKKEGPPNPAYPRKKHSKPPQSRFLIDSIEF